MAVSPELVRVAVTGAVSKGALGATAPTSSSSALTGFDDLGAISEDGVSLSLPDSGDAAPLLLYATKKAEADVLVAGAYGHPRLQEFIFGGTTRSLLAADQPSLFLSH